MSRNHIDIDLKNKYAIEAVKWCKKKLGVSKRKKRKLILKLSPKSRKMDNLTVFAVYCFYKNKITLYEPNCTTLLEVVSTIIHEYTHYLQSRTMYEKYEKTHYYSTNPLEKEALRNEKKYAKECLVYIKKLGQDL